MKRKKKSTKVRALPKRASRTQLATKKFDEVLDLIESARRRAFQLIKTELVSLYWQLGEYISKKIERAEWGDAVVDELATVIAQRYPGLRGYTRRNLFRMRQLFEAYRRQKKVSPLVSQLPWTHHLIILSQTTHAAEREYYLAAAIRERRTKRELERQITSGALLRSNVKLKKVSPAVTRYASRRGARYGETKALLVAAFALGVAGASTQCFTAVGHEVLTAA